MKRSAHEFNRAPYFCQIRQWAVEPGTGLHVDKPAPAAPSSGRRYRAGRDVGSLGILMGCLAVLGVGCAAMVALAPLLHHLLGRS